MCIQNTLQQYILDITNDGKTVADFFFATMRGNANIHHQLDAAKQLAKLCLTTGSIIIRPEPVKEHGRDNARGNTHSLSTKESWNQAENCETTNNKKTQAKNPTYPAHPVTDLDIINYEIASLIREETNDGFTIADFLARVMNCRDSRGNSASEADRMAAAKELMNRGFGKFGSSRNRRIPNSQEDQELIQSGLARYIRERSEYGLDAARFLLDVASGQDESFSIHQRVVATRELMRRGWDTNYDAITPKDIVAYYERQDALEPTDYDIRLQEWREAERAAQTKPRQDKTREDEPQLEAGIFAHLTEAEIARYKAMNAREQQEFIERQRPSRAPRTDNAHIDSSQPKTQDQTQVKTDAETNESSETIDLNTLLQEVNALSRIPHPTHPAHPVRSQTYIRSP
jgi:hypothetical protein